MVIKMNPLRSGFTLEIGGTSIPFAYQLERRVADSAGVRASVRPCEITDGGRRPRRYHAHLDSSASRSP
jgi:hypothetical protein